MSTAGAPPKVAFFGHFGSANPGNESTLLAILARLRQLEPSAEFNCICSDPAAVAAREGIRAEPITMRPHRIWNRELAVPRRMAMAFGALFAELREYRRAYRTLNRTQMLIVPGTGLVTDAYGLARWGPYNMFKWILMAKLRRAKVLFVSVGAGPIDGRAGRVLIRAALSLADYRSYRDQASKDYLTAIGFDTSHDPVYPDLVFGLPAGFLPADPRPAADTAPVVGLGLMVYAERYSTRNPRRETYNAYLESLADFAIWLMNNGYKIRLLLGDSDTIVIEQFRATLSDRAPYDPTLILEQPIRSVNDVLSEIAACDVVVATRFHNVLMAMLLNKPVIAISFHHKCASLMRQMNVSEYTHDIHELDTARLVAQFQDLQQNREAITSTLGGGVGAARASLDEQYDRLFAAAV